MKRRLMTLLLAILWFGIGFSWGKKAGSEELAAMTAKVMPVLDQCQEVAINCRKFIK